MKSKIENLGKVSITVEKEYWNINNAYNRLTIVERQGTSTAYLSRKAVPVGTDITNRNYWITISKWADIPYEIVQEFGDSTEVVVSQKVITLKINELQELIDNITEEVGVVDEHIAAASIQVKDDLIDGADEGSDTLNKLNTKLETFFNTVYSKTETYSKEQVNNLVTTPNQKYVTVSSYNSLPSTGSSDTIYRVGGTTSYSEYGWDGTSYVLLSAKNIGIDNMPTAGSQNFVTSGGVKEDTNKKVQINLDQNGNLVNLNDADILYGKKLNSDGTISDYETINTTGFIKISGDTRYYHAKNSTRFRVSVFYDENKNVINGSSIDTNHNDFVAPSNAHYVRISALASEWNTLQLSNSSIEFEEFTPIGGYFVGKQKVKEESIQDAAITNDKIADDAVDIDKIDIKSRETLIENCVPLAFGKNLFNKEDANNNIGNFLNSDGTISTASTYAYTSKYIIVKPNTNYYYSRESDQKCAPNSLGGASVCFYDSNKGFISSQGADIKTITTPNNCYYIRVSVYASYIDTEVQLEEGTSRTIYEEYNPCYKYLISSPIEKGFSYHGNMTANTEVRLHYTNVNKNAIFSFSAQLNGTFTTLEIGDIKLNNTIGSSIVINNTNVSYGNTSIAHGLVISNNIQVIIEAETQYKLKQIIICSNGVIASIDVTNFAILLNKGYAFAKSASSLNNVSFSWTTRDIDADVWVFGDSWVSHSNTRWPYYLAEYGYSNNVLINGFAGEKTEEALIALKTLLLIGIPKVVCWCMGMNNTDSSDAINSTWKDATEEVMNICAHKGIELILYTVPTTPSRNNNFKNAYVLASGYRYIDAVSALGADSNGNWYTGFEQSPSDHDHTSALGAKALFMQFMADVPEFAISK